MAHRILCTGRLVGSITCRAGRGKSKSGENAEALTPAWRCCSTGLSRLRAQAMHNSGFRMSQEGTCLLFWRQSVYRRHELNTGFGTERENFVLDEKGNNKWQTP